MNKLRPLQLAVLMVCARCFSMMTYFPYTHSNTLIFMVGILLSGAFQTILLIPAVAVCQKREMGLCEIAAARSVAMGRVVTCFFLAYFAWDIFVTTGNFAYFSDQYFSDQISRIPVVICAVGVAAYLGLMSSQVLGKCAGIMFALFAVFTSVLLLSTVTQPDLTNFHLAQRDIGSTIIKDAKWELIRNRELVMLVFLLGDVRGSKAKAAYGYIAIKIVILEVVMAFVTLVLGELAVETDMPFFYLSCYANSSVIERYDAGFMSVWTIMAVLRIAVMLHCFARCLQKLSGRLSRRSATITAIIPAAATIIVLSQRRWKSIAYLREPPLLIIAVAAIIPLAVALLRKNRRMSDESK